MGKFLGIIKDLILVLIFGVFISALLLKALSFTNWQAKILDLDLVIKYNLGLITYIIPLFEILVLILLSTSKFRNYGMIYALVLTTIYSMYFIWRIYLLNDSLCSCKGMFPYFEIENQLIINYVLIFLSLVYLNFPSISTKLIRKK